MLYLIELWESVRDFMATGGDVLWLVAGALFLMWALMLERYFYLSFVFPKVRKQVVDNWMAREDTTSWHAHRIREAWLSQAKEQLTARMGVINALVAICPMLGLLGTVTGMIAVFEVMAVQGTGNPRLMAGGISMATIPTMSGMVAALSGVFFSTRLNASLKVSAEKLQDSLSHH
ncbi:MotA/TolQ/ExbB proton channel family protein [Ferrimonas sediminicola]|uniref:MotA/TolQ/ExbB proton channel family protein n=1 Tax=Ferrimonas sediminicola TaxID=2569538 RepID=A0A4U1BBG2_9GAMM|nr:MotA/TolQ/ExbB proton channel family protein [Ferrimonas sediminicola]TKB48231.1 MotA/TolQ/ExbB proton channel family protein [Ferrimonas sediminicola]